MRAAFFCIKMMVKLCNINFLYYIWETHQIIRNTETSFIF